MDNKETVRSFIDMSGRSVINATGEIFHAGLTPPLSPGWLARLEPLRANYATTSGSERLTHQLVALTGAERTFAANNETSALLLSLASVASRRSVVVPRKSLVEFENGVRVEALVEAAGGRVIEVGASNRTRIEDYERAFGEEIAAVLVVGTSDVALSRIAELTRESKAGFLVHESSGDIRRIQEALTAGAALVSFPADRWLGGPDVGLVVGAGPAVESLERHPLARALEVDAMRRLVLDETLGLWLQGKERTIPLVRMREETIDAVGVRASLLAACVGDDAVVSRFDEFSGTPSVGVVIRPLEPQAFAKALREGVPRILSRTTSDAVLFDARTLADKDVMPLADVIRRALGEQGGRRLSLVSVETPTREGRRGPADCSTEG